MAAAAAFPKALIYGAVAAILGSIGYAMVWSLGFMISFVAIGIGWLVAKAMLAGSGGLSGRLYQIAAAGMTYLAVSCGKLILPALAQSRAHHPYPVLTLLEWAVFGPFLRLSGGPRAIAGIIILGVGVHYAWRATAGQGATSR
jgi:hypothetical protein